MVLDIDSAGSRRPYTDPALTRADMIASRAMPARASVVWGLVGDPARDVEWQPESRAMTLEDSRGPLQVQRVGPRWAGVRMHAVSATPAPRTLRVQRAAWIHIAGRRVGPRFGLVENRIVTSHGDHSLVTVALTWTSSGVGALLLRAVGAVMALTVTRSGLPRLLSYGLQALAVAVAAEEVDEANRRTTDRHVDLLLAARDATPAAVEAALDVLLSEPRE